MSARTDIRKLARYLLAERDACMVDARRAHGVIRRAYVEYARSCHRKALPMLAVLAMLGGCAAAPDAPSHNVHGGYIDACGDLPPLIGDDC